MKSKIVKIMQPFKNWLVWIASLGILLEYHFHSIEIRLVMSSWQQLGALGISLVGAILLAPLKWCAYFLVAGQGLNRMQKIARRIKIEGAAELDEVALIAEELRLTAHRLLGLTILNGVCFMIAIIGMWAKVI